MKEDYLWDKTGSDAEIENLENVLKAFRQTDDAPPEIPAKIFTPDEIFRRDEKDAKLFPSRLSRSLRSAFWRFLQSGCFRF